MCGKVDNLSYWRFLVCCVGLVLVVSACSSADEADGPDPSSGVEGDVSVTTAVPETTVPESLTGLELVIDGEPPSTTVSTDEVEQTAAEVVYWSDQAYFRCIEQIPNCDLSVLEQAYAGQALSDLQARSAFTDRELVLGPDPLDPEVRILWSRKSPDNPDDVVVVLRCARNYYATFDSEGNVVDDSSPVSLSLLRVTRGSDSQFRVTNFLQVDDFQPDSEGGDVCSDYTGEEATDVEVDTLYG